MVSETCVLKPCHGMLSPTMWYMKLTHTENSSQNAKPIHDQHFPNQGN
jgi:hypothetical protein